MVASWSRKLVYKLLMPTKERQRSMAREYSRALVVANNAVLAAWVVVSSAALLHVHPIAATTYLLTVATTVGYLLRKHLCTTCTYYGKVCGYGWGLLAAKLFPRNAGDRRLGEKLAGPTWAAIIAVPLAASAYVALQGSLYYVAAHVALLPLLIALRVKTCSACAERESCPLSSARKELR